MRKWLLIVTLVVIDPIPTGVKLPLTHGFDLNLYPNFTQSPHSREPVVDLDHPVTGFLLKWSFKF